MGKAEYGVPFAVLERLLFVCIIVMYVHVLVHTIRTVRNGYVYSDVLFSKYHFQIYGGERNISYIY